MHTYTHIKTHYISQMKYLLATNHDNADENEYADSISKNKTTTKKE